MSERIDCHGLHAGEGCQSASCIVIRCEMRREAEGVCMGESSAGLV